MQQNKNIFMVGFDKADFPDVDQYLWGWEINPADYDIGIFNMGSLHINSGPVTSEYLYELKKLIQEAQCKKGLEIYCIYTPPSKELIVNNVPLNYSWLPVVPTIRTVSKFTKINPMDEFGNKIKNYYEKYTMEDGFENISNTGVPTTEGQGSQGNTSLFTLIVQNDVHIQSSLNRPMFFSLNWKIVSNTVGIGITKILLDSKSSIHFLPYNENCNDVAKFILSEMNESEIPGWVDEIEVDNETKIKAEIKAYKEKIEEVTYALLEKEKELKIIQNTKKVLYETGKPLEKVVSRIFETLGVKLEKPDDRTLEDRYFEIDNVKIFVEIRGKENAGFLEKDLNQLIQRIADKGTHPIYPLRGIFVFNNQRLTNPKERVKPFTKNLTDKAKAFGICLIDTQTFFDIYKSKPETEKFRNKVFTSVGILEN